MLRVSILTGMWITKRCSNFEPCHSDYRQRLWYLQKWYRQRYLTGLHSLANQIYSYLDDFRFEERQYFEGSNFHARFPPNLYNSWTIFASVLHLNLVLSLCDKFLSLHQKIQCFLSQKSVSAR